MNFVEANQMFTKLMDYYGDDWQTKLMEEKMAAYEEAQREEFQNKE